MNLKPLSTGLAAISLALGLVVAPASFAHGAGPSQSTHASQQMNNGSGSRQGRSLSSNASDVHSSWWNNQSASSSKCATGHFGQCVV